MGKIFEAVFCIFYIALVVILGCLILKNSKGRKEILWFGIMSLVLVFGDSFHLVPRILEAFDPLGDYYAAKGIGTLITSITMTIFYLIMYFIYSMRYKFRNIPLMSIMIGLTAIRIVLCLLPQNDWTGEAPVIWGIYRNIPFFIMGLIMVVLFFIKRKDKPYGLMFLAIILSFLFYVPVVLWADTYPMIGMFMIPKTCMYIWIVVMGYKQSRKIFYAADE